MNDFLLLWDVGGREGKEKTKDFSFPFSERPAARVMMWGHCVKEATPIRK